MLDRIVRLPDHAPQDGNQVRLVGPKHHPRGLFEPDRIRGIGDGGQAVRHGQTAGAPTWSGGAGTGRRKTITAVARRRRPAAHDHPAA